VCENAPMTPVLQVVDKAFQDRLKFETMLSELSSRFVILEPDTVDGEIEDALNRICDALDLDLATLWQLAPDEPGVLRMTHTYRRLEGPPFPENFDARQYSPWVLERILEGQSVSVAAIDDAPPEAAVDYETWRYFNVKSTYVFPMILGGEKTIGAASFHAVREEGSWPQEIVQRLQLATQVLGNAIVRKRADAALRESEQRLQLAAESANVGMWMLDVESQRFWATDQARTIFGYRQDADLTMDLILESALPDSRVIIKEALRQAVEEGRDIDIEFRIVLPAGEERWMHSRGRVLPESATSPMRILGATMDITERKISEEQLRRSFAEIERLKDRLELENAYLQREHRLQYGSGRIIGESPALLNVLGLVEQVAPTGSTVLIEGETGTGKELIAQRIHELSPRSERPMVKVNCAALPSTLVESELFGHERGAYTGAVSRETGRFEVADGSTLFLDEISELPFELQSKLLRVLEEGQYERVGSARTLKTDVRVIAATNRDLRAEVESGRFRRDLFFRLAVFPIRVPPLRERLSDVPLLVWAFIHEFSDIMNKPVEKIPREDMQRLEQYEWSGNVRELRNVVERAMILCNESTLRIPSPAGGSSEGANGNGVLTMDEAQRRHILKALEAAGGRIRGAGGAAELLAMNPSTLRSRMRRLGIDPSQTGGDISPPR
jgi:formate hydrogenlyase transcriptional activator